MVALQSGSNGFGWIPTFCTHPNSPSGGGSQLVDLQNAVNQAVQTLEEIRDEIISNPDVDPADYTAITDRLDELIAQGKQPQLLPEDYSELLTQIRNLLGDVAIALPDLFKDLALEVRGNIDRVVQKFIEQEGADERRHTETLDLLNKKLSVKRVTKLTRWQYIDARQNKITVDLPEGSVSWKIYPMCFEGQNLVQDIAHQFVINGEVFRPGEVASDEAMTVGNQVGTLESRTFEMNPGAGIFRIVWSYLSNMPIGEVTMTTDDGTPSTEVIDEGEIVADGDAVPENDAPGGDAPAGDAPGGDAPAGDAPGGDAPAGDAPGGDLPEDNDPDNFA